jgi:hypothetical protein
MILPSFPVSTFKLTAYCGIGILIYTAGAIYTTNNSTHNLITDYRGLYKQLENEKNLILVELRDAKKELDFQAAKQNISIPTVDSNSGSVYTALITTPTPTYNSTIDSLIKKYDSKTRELAIKNSELSIKEYQIDRTREQFDTDLFSGLLVMGLVLFVLGCWGWISEETENNRYLQRQNLDKPTFSDECQSCGKHFNSFIRYGSERDGKSNYHFCEKCYLNGEFTEPNLTTEVLIKKAISELSLGNATKAKINKVTKMINRLDRWKPHHY